MAFDTKYIGDPGQIGEGMRGGDDGFNISTTSFEDGLIVGRFAKLDAGSIDKMDASATPVIAGVVLRNIANPIEDGATYDSALWDQIDYRRRGSVTVRVKTGETPAQFGKVYAENTADVNTGMALAAAGANGVEVVGAEFIEEVQAGVWLVYLG